MAIDTTWVRYGAPAADALWRAVRAAKAGEPLAPVTVVVPSNHLGVAARRRLASGTSGAVCGSGVGLAAVTFATTYRLAEVLGAPALAAQGRRPVSTPVVAAAVRAALAEDPGLFAPVVEHPATEAALVATYRELRALDASALAQLARRSRRAADVVRLHHAVRAHLVASWYDEDDLTASAALAVAAGAGADLGPLVVHLPQQLVPGAAALLRALAAHAEVHVLAGTTGHPRADAEVLAAVALLDPGAGAPPVADPLVGVATPATTQVVLTADADDEVRAAVRAVVDATRRGVPLDRMAVLYASPSPYARLVHEQLAAADIPANGAAVVPLAGRVAGRTLLGLLDWPTNGYRRSDLMALLAGAPVRLDGRRAPLASWEEAGRAAAVVAGRAQWDQRLAVRADGLDEQADARADDPQQVNRVAGLRRAATLARGLRTFALGLIDELERAATAPRGWDEHVAWARHHLTRLLGDDRHRDGWPPAEQRAAERVDVALDRLGALASFEGPVRLEVFTRTLALELEDDLVREGRFGEGVLVGSVGLAVGLDLDLVVVLGLAEGSFPGPVADDSLLPDHDRAAVGLPLRHARVERQHHQFLAALAGSGRHHLGVPRGDLRRSAERVPSRWVLDVAGHLGGRRVRSSELAGIDAPWVHDVASFDAGLRAVTFPATEQEHRLRTLLATDDPAATDDPVVAQGLEVLAARRSDRFTRYDGNLAGASVPSPVDRTTSTTRLERWAGCPFAYFLHDVLGVADVVDPDEQLELTPLDKGNLVHEVLERFLREVLARPTPPEHDQPWTAADRARLEALAERVCDRYEAQGLTGRAIFWRRDRTRIMAELQRALSEDDAYRLTHGTRPVAAELPFGGTRDVEVTLPLPDGRTLRMRGQADRIDVGADGRIHVVDYKTGSTRSYAGLGVDDPDSGGRHLQLAVYGLAARAHLGLPDADVRADYWFVSDRGDFKRLGYAVTSDVLAQVGTTVGALVAGIEAGIFPSRPTAKSTSFFNECPACDPDFLGVGDLRRAWERKRADPRVAAYAALAEPLGDEGDDG